MHKKMNKKGILCGLLAATLTISGISAGFLASPKQAYAKETLQSITEVIDETTDDKPYNLLEIVPDRAHWTYTYSDRNGNPVSISVAQSTGQIGYYIKGQEPVVQDLLYYLSDEAGTVINESSAREDFARLLIRAIAGETEAEASSIVTWDESDDSFPVYYDGEGYRELRQGEVIPQTELYRELNIEQGDEAFDSTDYVSEDALATLLKNGRYYTIRRNYKIEAEGDEASAYIDYAYGKMTAAHGKLDAGKYANYSMVYIPDEDASTDPARLFLGKDNCAAENGNFKTIDLMNPGWDEMSGSDRGEFDPCLIWDATSGITEERARYRAIFEQDPELTSGYTVAGITSVEYDENALVLGVVENTPVYVKEVLADGTELYHYYGYAKADGTIEQDERWDLATFSAMNIGFFSFEEEEEGAEDEVPEVPEGEVPGDKSANGVDTDTPLEGDQEDDNPPSNDQENDNPPSNDQENDNPPSNDQEDDNPPSNDQENDNPPSNDQEDDNPPSNDQEDDNPPSNDQEDDNPPSDDQEDDNPPSDEPEAGSDPNVTTNTVTMDTNLFVPVFLVSDLDVGDLVEPEKEPEEELEEKPKEDPEGEPQEENLEEEPEDDDSSDEEDEIDMQDVRVEELYCVQFAYSDSVNDGTPLYRLMNFTEDNNGEYTIPQDGACIRENKELCGTIKVKDASGWSGMDADNFVYEYTPEAGCFDWTGKHWLSDEETAQVYRIRGAEIYFATGLVNRDFFKQYVFDRELGGECNNLPVTVTTAAATDYLGSNAGTNSEEDFKRLVMNHKMLLLMSKNTEFCVEPSGGVVCNDYGNVTDGVIVDIPAPVFISVIVRAVEEKIPVVSDYTILGSSGEEKSNAVLAARLVRALNLNNLEPYYVTLPRDHSTLNGTENPVQFGTYKTVNGYHNVNGNIYTYNVDEPEEGNTFVSNGLTDVFTKDIVAEAFAEVLVDIESENLYRKTDGNRPLLSTDISQASVLRYIIGYPYKRSSGIKENIHVLEIEPGDSYDLQIKDGILYKETEGQLEEWIKPEAEGVTIKLTQMTTSEFIGHIEDINAFYDMVYVGMNTDMMNTDAATGETSYNDTSMNGLVYSNVGDYIFAKQVLAGIISNDYLNGDKNSTLRGWYQMDVKNGKLGRYRYSGNDITQEKMEDIRDYVKAGYPIVLADDFVNIDSAGKKTVNAARVDSSSYMYRCIDAIKDEDNVFTEQYVTGDLFKWYLNLQKPELNLYGVCKEAQDATVALSASGDGGYYASYEFVIYNRGAADAASDFDCNVYIDINADGKYSPTTEEIDYLSIADSYGSAAAYEDGAYRLRAGQKYYASFRLSEAYAGIMPWKLEIVQNDNSYRRTAATGYYEVIPDSKIPIKVLQMKSSIGNNWDMAADLANSNSQFYRLMNDSRVRYDVTIDSLSANEFNAIATVADMDDYSEYLDYLEQYDMLVMGFADCFVGPNMEATRAIKEYIARGNSILFTHDTTSFVNVPDDRYTTYWGDRSYQNYPVLKDIVPVGWGYEFNTQIRNLVGMDRYNVLNGPTDGNATYSREIPHQPGTDTEIMDEAQGYTYFVLSKYAYGYPSVRGQHYDWSGHDMEMVDKTGTAFPITRGYTKNMKLWEWGDYSNSYVTQVNNGQITTYPYVLEEEFPVATTHAQYYQLDLTADDDFDGESDIVVWYCLGGSSSVENDIYELSPNDVRNNYYIYNKGNITYSGVGHSKVEGEQEMKLFVNTLIAAYRAGVHEPVVKIKDGYGEKATEIKNIYISYDKQLELLESELNGQNAGGLLDETDELYFTAETVSLIQNAANTTRKIGVQLYYEVPAETGQCDRKLSFGDSYIYLNELPLGQGEGATGYDSGLYTLSGDGVTEVVADKNNIISGKTYKLKIPTMNLMKNKQLWETTETQSSLQALNKRRVYIIVTEQVENSRTGRVESAHGQDSVSLVRVQLFDLD